MADVPEFDYHDVPPVAWELGEISRLKRVIELSEKEHCLDCIPHQYAIPWAPEGYDSPGMWILVQLHDTSCPSYHQRPKGMEMLEE